MRDEASPTRVLLFDMPPLMRDLIHAAVDGEDDVELVGEADGSSRLAAAIARTGPDLLIVPADEDELPAAAIKAFDTSPRLKVLVLAGAGARAFLWELSPRRVYWGQMSRSRLLAAMRQRGGWEWNA